MSECRPAAQVQDISALIGADYKQVCQRPQRRRCRRRWASETGEYTAAAPPSESTPVNKLCSCRLGRRQFNYERGCAPPPARCERPTEADLRRAVSRWVAPQLNPARRPPPPDRSSLMTPIRKKQKQKMSRVGKFDPKDQRTVAGIGARCLESSPNETS